MFVRWSTTPKDAMCDVGQWNQQHFVSSPESAFCHNSYNFAIVLDGSRCCSNLMSRLDDLVRIHKTSPAPVAFFLSLRNWFRFNRLRESENLWFRVENWPPFNCTFLLSRQLCDATMPLLSTEMISFLFMPFFRWKSLKEICLIQFLLILNLWLSGRHFFRLHFSRLSNSTNTICHEFLNYNFTKMPFFFFVSFPFLSSTVKEHHKSRISNTMQNK